MHNSTKQFIATDHVADNGPRDREYIGKEQRRNKFSILPPLNIWKMRAFWDVTLRNLADIDQRFRRSLLPLAELKDLLLCS